MVWQHINTERERDKKERAALCTKVPIIIKYLPLFFLSLSLSLKKIYILKWGVDFVSRFRFIKKSLSLCVAVCDYVNTTHNTTPRRRRRRTLSLAEAPLDTKRFGAVEVLGGFFANTHGGGEREKEESEDDSRSLSLSLSRAFSFRENPIQFSLRVLSSLVLWRRLFLLLLLPNNAFDDDDDVEKTLLFWREEKPHQIRGDDGGFEGRAETRGNAEEASRAAGRRKTSSPSFKVVQ